MKLRSVALMVLLAIVATLAVHATRPAMPAAAEGIEVQNQSAQNRFPNGIQFSAFIRAPAEVKDVRLRYRLLPDGATVLGRPQCTPGLTVQCNIMIGSTSSLFLVPGVVVVYSWEAEDSAGNKVETAEQTFTYEDTRFRWESMSRGKVSLFYYSGSEAANRQLLDAAAQTIERMSKLIGTTVDFPVKVFAYATAADMRPAILSNRRIPPNPNNPTTLGEVVYSDTALVSRDRQALDIVRHEVTHIVMRAAMKGALGDAPAWVDEGIAVYAQERLLPDETGALEAAIRANRVLPIFSLSSTTLTQTDTSLFYAQSWSTVKYLIDTYGEAKFADFIRAFRDNTTEGALKQAYGIDLATLENAWRRSVGLPPVAQPSGGQTSPDRPLPTIVPFGAGGQPAPTPSGGGQQGETRADKQAGGGGGLDPIVIIGALTALLVVAILGLGVYVAKKTAA